MQMAASTVPQAASFQTSGGPSNSDIPWSTVLPRPGITFHVILVLISLNSGSRIFTIGLDEALMFEPIFFVQRSTKASFAEPLMHV